MIVVRLTWNTKIVQSHAKKVWILSFVVGPPPKRVFDVLDGLPHVFVKFVSCDRGLGEGYISKIICVAILNKVSEYLYAGWLPHVLWFHSCWPSPGWTRTCNDLYTDLSTPHERGSQQFQPIHLSSYVHESTPA